MMVCSPDVNMNLILSDALVPFSLTPHPSVIITMDVAVCGGDDGVRWPLVWCNLKRSYATDSWDKDIKRCVDILHDWLTWEWVRLATCSASCYDVSTAHGSNIMKLLVPRLDSSRKKARLPPSCGFCCADLAQLTKGNEGEGLTLSTQRSVVHLTTLSYGDITWADVPLADGIFETTGVIYYW